MVVDHNDISAELVRSSERLSAGRSTINRYNQPRAFLGRQAFPLQNSIDEGASRGIRGRHGLRFHWGRGAIRQAEALLAGVGLAEDLAPSDFLDSVLGLSDEALDSDDFSLEPDLAPAFFL